MSHDDGAVVCRDAVEVTIRYGDQCFARDACFLRDDAIRRRILGQILYIENVPARGTVESWIAFS
jgi:hypothetical protein